MKTKNKILIVCCLVAILLCSLCIFPSAETEERAVPDTVIEAGTYTFNDTLTLPPFGSGVEGFTLYVGDTYYEGISFNVYEGRLTLSYIDAGDYMDVFNNSDGWYDNAYKTVTIPDDITETLDGFAQWFIKNTTPPSDEPIGDGFSIYDGFYDLIVEYVYGSPAELDTTQKLCATFFATCGSFVLVALPLVLVIWIAKFLLSMIVRI